MFDNLSTLHRRYIFCETVISIVINVILSVGFALLTSAGFAKVPLWGLHGMALDFVPQVFMVTFATTLASTACARMRIRRLQIPSLVRGPPAWLSATHSPFMRAILFATIAVFLFVPLSVGLLTLLSIHVVAAPVFVFAKALYGGALAATLSPVIIALALTRRHIKGIIRTR